MGSCINTDYVIHVKSQNKTRNNYFGNGPQLQLHHNRRKDGQTLHNAKKNQIKTKLK